MECVGEKKDWRKEKFGEGTESEKYCREMERMEEKCYLETTRWDALEQQSSIRHMYIDSFK